MKRDSQAFEYEQVKDISGGGIVIYGPVGPGNMSNLVLTNLIRCLPGPPEKIRFEASRHLPAHVKIAETGKIKLLGHYIYHTELTAKRWAPDPIPCYLIRNNFRQRNRELNVAVSRELGDLIESWRPRIVIIVGAEESEDEDMMEDIYLVPTHQEILKGDGMGAQVPAKLELTEISGTLLQTCQERDIPAIYLLAFSKSVAIEEEIAKKVTERLISILQLEPPGLVNYEYLEAKSKELKAEVKRLIKQQLEKVRGEMDKANKREPQFYR